MARRVVVWRHGQTSWNRASRFQGHSDIALDEVGLRQAETAAAALVDLEPAAIASSDLVRARATAAALARMTGHEVITDSSLREAFAAAWEGLTRDEIVAQDRERFQRWRTDAAVRPGGDGETAHEVGERMSAAVQRHVAALPDGATLVVVTHGGAARALIGQLLGWPVDAWKRMAVLGNCAWAELDVDSGPGWRLHSYNRAVA